MRLERLFAAGTLRRLRRRRRPQTAGAPLALAGLALASIGFASLADPAPRLVWNASASVPIGLYVVAGGAPQHGDLVLAVPPPDVRRLAAERGYLPEGVPLVKRIAAATGDLVCAADRTVFINGVAVATVLASDARRRPMPQWHGCVTLDADTVLLLLADVPTSFDGRYFGPSRRADLRGRLVPMWTFGSH